jgi:hypothetical protein
METLIIKTPDKATADNIRLFASQFENVQVADEEIDALTAGLLSLNGAWGDREVSAEQLRKEAWDRNPA